MSWQAIEAVFAHSISKGRDLLVLLAIAKWADETGANAYPGAARLAQMARCDIRAVRRAIQHLKDGGELWIDRKGGGRGTWNPATGKQPGIGSIYRITLPIPGEGNSGATVAASNSGHNATVEPQSNGGKSNSNGGKSNSNSGPSATPLEIDQKIRSTRKRSTRSADDPNASFWNQKPIKETANAVSHTRLKSRKKERGAGGQGSALNQWFRTTLLPAYPRHRLSNIPGALRWLKDNHLDEAARAAIMARLSKWLACDEWHRDDAQYVPDIAKFLSAPKYHADPPGYQVPKTKPPRTDKEIWH